MILFRCAPSGYPFLWESAELQPAGRWHRAGAGPVQYFADTPDGAWAEIIRHLEITEPIDLAGIRQTLWAVEVPDDLTPARARLDRAALASDRDGYPVCQAEAERLRLAGAGAIAAPSAALHPGEARGWRVDNGLRAAEDRDGQVIVLFGVRPALVAWRAAVDAQPDAAVLPKVRHFRRRGASSVVSPA